MGNIVIPPGRKLRLNMNGSPVVDNGVDVYIAEEITITLSSEFESIMGGGGANKLFTILGQLSSDVLGFGFSGQFKQMGFQIWSKTDPLSLSATVRFDMGSNNLNDGYQEVFYPTMKLIGLPLPTNASKGNGIGLIPPGPSILGAFDKTKNIVKGKILSMEIGNILRVNNIIVKKAEPTFSDLTDENGYPVWAKVQLDIESVFTATTDMIQVQIGDNRNKTTSWQASQTASMEQAKQSGYTSTNNK